MQHERLCGSQDKGMLREGDWKLDCHYCMSKTWLQSSYFNSAQFGSIGVSSCCLVFIDFINLLWAYSNRKHILRVHGKVEVMYGTQLCMKDENELKCKNGRSSIDIYYEGISIKTGGAMNHSSTERQSGSLYSPQP